ncbi:MAG: hypothetical protein PHU51_04660, partial [Candidatus Nanoarchaeia archaeon]|nr:hypothetical protein [Candidatus Nanoarchaeia archaeon]
NIREQLFSGNYSGAHKHLDDLHSYVENEENIQKKIINLEEEIEHAVRDIRNAENELKDLMR